MPRHDCSQCGRRVPWLSFAGNLTLTFYKVAIGILGGSAALVADGVHSFTDVIGTSAIIISRRVSEQPADEGHPYGYGKAEFVGSAFIYCVLLVLSIFIAVGAIRVMVQGDIVVPRFVTLLAAVVSVFYNILMYSLGLCAGKKNNSPALLANSFENRADAISSTAVIIGITLALFVHPICDPIAALVVGIVIFVNCLVQLRESAAGLMDRSLPPEVVARIGHVVAAQRGVTSVEYIRTRQVGTGFWLDVGIHVSGSLDMKRAQHIAATVRGELLSRSQRLEEVEIFITSADEDTRQSSRGVWWGRREAKGEA